jgi:anti-anti-sigma regulatory factor
MKSISQRILTPNARQIPMTVRITQVDNPEKNHTILHVEGSLIGEDASLLEEIYLEVRVRLGHAVVIDLTALHMLNEASAALLYRLKHQPGVSLFGCQLFIKQMIETTADSQDENADATPAVPLHTTKTEERIDDKKGVLL